MSQLLSISVMAHESRARHFDYLKERLGDVPFAIDKQGEEVGIWENRKRALKLHGDSKYHLVVQDDAIVCDNFRERAEAFIQKIEAFGYPSAFQFFIGERYNFATPHQLNIGRSRGYLDSRDLAWGVAIAFLTEWIPECITYGDWYPAWQDDTKIKYFLKKKKAIVHYPVPCLIDHRPMDENPTLTPSKDSNRVSPIFIDNV